jgi:hypothetical protein
MPDIFVLALGVFAALPAAINTLQVFLGRQLIKPSASRRSAPQLRAESGAAAMACSVSPWRPSACSEVGC